VILRGRVEEGTPRVDAPQESLAGA